MRWARLSSRAKRSFRDDQRHGRAQDLEPRLEVVRALAPGEMGGVFGPDSLTWRIDREALAFLGAGRRFCSNRPHPWVAAAIVQHSRAFADPIGSFHRTFAVVFTMVFRRDGPGIESATRRWHADQSCR